MKIIYAFIALAVVALSSVRAEEANSAYQQAVDSYVNAATLEMKAIHQQVESAAEGLDDESKPELESLADQVKQCNALLEKLKEAGPDKFDVIKAKYEANKRDVLQGLSEIHEK